MLFVYRNAAVFFYITHHFIAGNGLTTRRQQVAIAHGFFGEFVHGLLINLAVFFVFLAFLERYFQVFHPSAFRRFFVQIGQVAVQFDFLTRQLHQKFVAAVADKMFHQHLQIFGRSR